MSGLETINGRTAFASARVDAYHQLGQVVDQAMTAEQALELGMLAGWNMRKVPLFAHVPLGADGSAGTMQVQAHGRYGVVRDNPVIKDQIDFIGDVGQAYQIIHPEDLTDLLNTLVDESGAHFETVGSLDGGKKVFVTMKLPGGIKIGGVDPVDTYLAAMTSNDGSSATSLFPTPVRITCENTMNLAFHGATNMFRVRHTVGAHKILVQQAREALDFTFSYLDGFQKQAEQLINTTMTQNTFEEIITREFGAADDAPAGTQTRSQNKIDEMARLFSDAKTHEDVRNTAWAGLNALTEWNDHFSPVRGVAAADESLVRSRKAILDPNFKNRALQLMAAGV